MTIIAEVSTLEFILRVVALLVTASAASFVWYQLFRHKIRPRPVWIYVGVVTGLTAVWRLVVLMFVPFPWLIEVALRWVLPITATSYIITGIALILLAWVATRGRRADE